MSDNDNKRAQIQQNTSAAKRTRRQELYMMMEPDKKEASLARQRANKLAAKNCRLQNSDSPTSTTLPPIETSGCFSEQASSIVRRSLLLGQTGSTSAAQPSDHTKTSITNINSNSSLTSPGEDTNQVVRLINIQDQTSYTHLKSVPNCKFCGAKRFEYESPVVAKVLFT